MSRAWRSALALAVVGCAVTACTGGSGGEATSAPSPAHDTGAPAVTSPPEPATSEPATPTGGDALSTDSKVTVETAVTGLHTPWGIDFLPDGTALVTDRDNGVIHSISPSYHKTRVGTVDGVVPGAEAGLLGIAISPHFTQDHRIYVYYSAKDDNRIAEITYRDGTLSDQHDILTGIPRGPFHNGGALVFGPDGMLYAGTGDAMDHPGAQRLGYLGGKILRMKPDGDPAPDHPFAKAPLVYSYGHRNIEGLAFDRSGRLWESEFGENTWDELNLITKGGNYGWPRVEGPSDDEKFVPPKRVWHTPEASPSGLAIWQGSAWLASLRGERLWQVPLQGTGTRAPKARFEGRYGRLRAAVTAPDGSLWVGTSNTDGRGSPRDGDDRILRITAG